MKKILAVLLALFMLVGCGSGSSSDSTDEDVNVLANVNVRQALSYALDRDAIVTSVNDGSIAAYGIIARNLGYNPETGADFRDDNGNVVSYDLAKAQEYLATAKEELGKDTISVDLLYGTNEGDTVIKVAEQVAYYLDEAGFEVNLVAKQKKERLALAAEGDFDIMLTRWGPDYADPQTTMDLFVSTNTDNNYGLYNSEEYDSLIKAAEEATDPAVRYENFLEAEKVLVEQDMGVVPVFQTGNALIVRPGVSGIEFHSAFVDCYRNVTGKDAVVIDTPTDVLSWDTCIATDGTSFSAQMEMLAGLTRVEADGSVTLDLAESYEVNDDQTVYTFKIKDDAKWSNGADVTAADFVFAWDRLTADETASEYSWWLDTFNIDSYQALDDKTLEVTLSRPTQIFLQGVAFPVMYPINEEFYESCGDLYATDPEHMLFCGPYTLESWTQGTEYVFVKNAGYVNAADYAASANKVTFKVYEDNQTALMDYEAGNTDTVYLSGEQVSANADKDGFERSLQGYVYYLQININHK